MDRADGLPNLTTGQVRMPGYFVASPADCLLDVLVDARGDERVLVADRMLILDPGCIEALLVLADDPDNRGTAIRYLERAVKVGEMLWSQTATQLGGNMPWWDAAGTRPYMRALASLGDAYMEVGDGSAARVCFDRLLAMQPRDSMKVRFRLAELDEWAPRRGMP